MPRILDDLSPTEFENLGFDLMQAAGMMNLVWRTPGPDGGRDLEGILPIRDLSGYEYHQLWYIESKRYNVSLDWPTVWKKIAFAENARAHYLLIFTNSNPSPQCESEITRWNSNNYHLKVRVWRGYDLRRILTRYPSVAAKYGFITSPNIESMGFLTLVEETRNMVQAAYVAYQINLDGQTALEAASALFELLSLRMSDLARYGRLVTAPPAREGKLDYDWLITQGDTSSINDTCLRALSATLKYITKSTQILIKCDRASEFEVASMAAKLPLNSGAEKLLSEVALWTDWEIQISNRDPGTILVRRRFENG